MATILVLGSSCEACDQQVSNALLAVERSTCPGTVDRVTDVLDITAFKVSVTPALVMNGEVKCVGRVASISEITDWLEELMD